MSFLAALHGKNEGRPPIWLMRQAGRYLPEYRKLKEGRRLFDLFHDPEMIVKITKLPIDLLQVDAAILFSDILTVFDALQIRYDFLEGTGPVVYENQMAPMVEAKSAYAPVLEAIRLLKRELKVPLIGFAGAPFTLACYLIEKKTSKEQKEAKKLLYSDPETFQRIIDQLTDAIIAFLKAQEDAGVDAIQIFDSWAGILAPDVFQKYCIQPQKRIVQALKVPSIVFCRGSSFYTKELMEVGAHAISIDWLGDLPAIRTRVPHRFALQGNLDPMALYAPKGEIKKAADRILKGMQGDKGFIFNLGHGLLPDTPADHVKALVEYVRTSS